MRRKFIRHSEEVPKKVVKYLIRKGTNENRHFSVENSTLSEYLSEIKTQYCFEQQN